MEPKLHKCENCGNLFDIVANYRCPECGWMMYDFG